MTSVTPSFLSEHRDRSDTHMHVLSELLGSAGPQAIFRPRQKKHAMG